MKVDQKIHNNRKRFWVVCVFIMQGPKYSFSFSKTIVSAQRGKSAQVRINNHNYYLERLIQQQQQSFHILRRYDLPPQGDYTLFRGIISSSGQSLGYSVRTLHLHVAPATEETPRTIVAFERDSTLLGRVILF